LAESIDTSQNQIYRLENPSTSKPTISTLKKLAAVFDVGLMVRFMPFSQMIAWKSGTPFTDYGLSSASLYVPSFSQEYESPDALSGLGKIPQPKQSDLRQNDNRPSLGSAIPPLAPLLADAAD